MVTKAFPLLFFVAWATVAVLVKWEARWLYLFLGLTVAAGLWMGRNQPIVPRILLALALVFPAWKKTEQWRHRATDGKLAVVDAPLISALVASEETLLSLSSRMASLSNGLQESRLPGSRARAEAVFEATPSVSDLGPFPPSSTSTRTLIEAQQWPVSRTMKEVVEVDLWRSLLDNVAQFEHARFHLVDGEHPGGDMLRYEAKCRFEALAQMKSGEWRSLNGRISLTWRRQLQPEKGLGDWKINRWETEEMQWIASPRRMFVESLESAMHTPEEVQNLRRSGHYEATVRFYQGGMKTPPHPYFSTISANHKEGIAVADVDGDGFDDIYITVRIGKNMLLHNNGDGTFTESAARLGLDLPGHTTCATFADFDNDGDLDAMLGRSLLKTTYLENRRGHFYQQPIPGHFPMAVVSMSAADYNRDGLLDVYLCTYRAAAPPSASPAGGVARVEEGAFDWPDEFFSPELAREFRRRLAENKQQRGGTVLHQVGPPNVLLVNRGNGQFEPAPENSVVGIWRNSFQATWCDYDQDGDPDLFIANDWAPSNLFRNDGAAGFKDVTEEAGTTAYGFSMGATWGDYNNDGLEDVYVSNMYSEAGRRMTALIPGLTKQFAESAAGNWLYRQVSGGRFELAAGMDSPTTHAMNAGWSWGGCFADFDHDTFLDLYVLSGYFTAPEELSSGLDLESNLWRTMLRTDENLSRRSFRFSPEWKRTPPPDNAGPEIESRIEGVHRHGEKLLVHSLQGHERNHYFKNRNGSTFQDLSGLSGLDNPADSRGFAILDYDHDGWQDIALVNANEPLFNLYHNEMPASGVGGGMIAIRFVGGNRTASPSPEFACRDGYGARVTVGLGDAKLIREHRCGEGWSTQNSATMIIGIGSHPQATSITVRWPSGRTASIASVREGTLLTAYENPSDSPSGEAFTEAGYRKGPARQP